MRPPLPPAFSTDLLTWYDGHGRKLPWRGSKDVYRVWLSEVMLQQTQVSTVVPYYERWLSRFPGPAEVAAADSQEVLKMWEGLGYYRRALQFQKACQIILQDFDGQIPADAAAFRQLPGVGAYTLAAVQSICFGEPLPAVDGNLRRVTARLLQLGSSAAALTRAATAALAAIIPLERPGDFNQALMDLGATICTPNRPRCGDCPVTQHCQAAAAGRVDQYPAKLARKVRPHFQIAIGIVWKADRLLISRRPTGGLLGGLWEFPGGKVELGESAEEAVHREVQEEVGLNIQVGQHMGTIRHAYTHFSITMAAYHCLWQSGEPQPLQCTDVRWVTWPELEQYPFPGANRKLFPLLNGEIQRVGMPA